MQIIERQAALRHAQPAAARVGQRVLRESQRGMSLVAMMVAAAIGLFIAAAATQFFVGQVQSARRMALDARLHQDLRAAADLMSRDLRRAGYWQGALQTRESSAQTNPYARIELTGSPNARQARYSHSRDNVEDGLVGSHEAAGFRVEDDSLQALVGGRWQALTDPSVVQITHLAITAHAQTVSLGHLCTPACTDSDAACPRLTQRRLRIELAGRSASDPGMVRQLQTDVRVRNDDIGSPRCPEEPA